MNNALASQCVLSGILDGNERLAQWTGGEEWICNRGGVESALVYGVADRVNKDMPGWLVWPETKTGIDFKWVGTKYRDYVDDCPPVKVFGGVRYDLGLLRPPTTISGLVEIKCAWSSKHLEENKKIGDLPKLARSLYYLGIKPQRVQDGVKRGVLLESVFFGTFIYHDPNASDANMLPLEQRYREIKGEINAWWQRATTGGGALIQGQFKTNYRIPLQPKIETTPKAETHRKGQLEAGAICVYLSLNEDP